MRSLIQPQELSTAGFAAQIDRLSAVYAAAMRPDPAQLPGRRVIMERHAQHPGFRALVVTAQADEDSQVIGFGYGFRGTDGQWWHDVVRTALVARLGDAATAAWLGSSMEVAELHVHPGFQRRGIGRSLLLGLTAGRPEHTAVLSTQDDNVPARRLYRSVGFADLRTGFGFPGGGPSYAVMGAVLPLRPAAQAGDPPASGAAPASPSPSNW